MVAIAISFFVMILAVSVSSGFRHVMRSAVADISGDISVMNPSAGYNGGGEPLPDTGFLGSVILGNPEVMSVVPAVYRSGIIKGEGVISGAIFKGVPGRPDSLRVSVPSSLARELSVGEGDDFIAYFIEERVRTRRFHVDSVYEDLPGTDGKPVVFAGISDMRRLNSWSDDQASSLEVRLRGGRRKAQDLARVKEDIGTRLLLNASADASAPMARSAAELFPQVFAWLDLIDRNVLVILILMTVVAGFNMVSGLLILLFRNIRTIGTLKTLGMRDSSIAAVFLRLASGMVLKGMAAGNLLALLICLLQQSARLIKLNPANYFVSYVPVHFSAWGILAADAAAYAAIMLLLLLPCLFISGIDPSLTVRVK